MSIVQDTDQRWWDLFSRRQAAEHQTLRNGLGEAAPNGHDHDDGHPGNGNGNGHRPGRGKAGRNGHGPDDQVVQDLALRILATHTACGWAHSWPPAAREQLLGPLGLTSHHLTPGNGAAKTTYPLGVISPLLQRNDPGPAATTPRERATGDASTDPRALAEAMQRATDALPLALPTELLLSQAGDDRIIPDPQTGLNRYGCRPCPTPGVAAWGSCSANSPSPRAFDAAEQSRQRMLLTAVRTGDLGEAGEQAATAIRARLHRVLDLDQAPACRIVLSPSGTDAEYVCTLMAFGDDTTERLVNLVVAPKEIGSGSGLAAAGEHISNIAPAGCHIPKADPLNGFPVHQLDVQAIGVRDEAGKPRRDDELERDLEARIERAIAANCRVLLHLVDSSKTGLTRPSLAFAEAMRRRHGERLRLVVDAAQGRFEPATLHAYLRAGCMVILSGSKFYAGPSFSGAVLIPSDVFVDEPRTAPPLGLSEYLTCADLPADWARWRNAMTRSANPSLMMRWDGALAEMEAYHALDGNLRRAARAALATEVRRAFEAHGPICAEAPTCCAMRNDIAAGPSIFTFSIQTPDGKLDYDAAREVYRAMSRDAAHDLPTGARPADRDAAGRLFNIGQPLCFGADRYGAFRIAISAPMVTRLATASGDPANLARHVEPDARDLDALLTKLTALAAAQTRR